jgi:hypothetical protein
MTEKKLNENHENSLLASQTKPGQRQAYKPPLVLSAERLEAVAAACDPPAPPFGKTLPFPCGTLGS